MYRLGGDIIGVEDLFDKVEEGAATYPDVSFGSPLGIEEFGTIFRHPNHVSLQNVSSYVRPKCGDGQRKFLSLSLSCGI